MPRMSAASNPSRSVTTNVAPMGRELLGNDAAARLLVEVVEERVGAGLEGADPDVDRLAGRHDLLDAEILALELGGLRPLVRDDEHERGVRLDLHLARLELALVEGQGDFRRRVSRRHPPGDREEAEGDADDLKRETPAHPCL